MSTVPVMPHRNSISKRSSFHSKQGIDSNNFNTGRNEQQRKNVKGVTGHGQNEMRNTMTRLDYLNRKFNVNPSFDIEISGDEEENDGNNDDTKHDLNEIQHIDIPYDTELININVKQKQVGINEMSKNLDESISLLSPLFEYIQNFETNLQKLSNEMEVLQTRLIKLDDEIKQNSKLDNLLTPILNDLLISPSCIKILVHHIIDEQWVNQLVILQEKKEILQNYENNERVNNNNIIELVDLIDKLEIKCVERIKFFLIENIKYLRNINASSVKVQNKLLKVKEIFKFLENKNSKLAKEFEIAYIYTIRWYYYFNFVKYINSLESLKILENDYDIENNSNDKNNANSNLNSTSRSLSLDNSNSINEYLINLPKRFEQMNDENNKFSILGQIAESNNVNNALKFFMEQIFQFLNQTMMDNFTIEFNFIIEFFHLKQSENLNNMTKQIFSPILKLGNNFTKYLVNNCKSDYFGILYTIRKIQRMEYEIQSRCLPEIFENYLNTQLLLLWPVFQRNVDTLCHNITSTLSSTLIIKQVVNNKNNILVPLKLTQSFSMIISNLEKLVQKLVFELETSEPLNRSIDRLSNTFEKGIVHLASSLDESKRRLFLYVNFELVFNVLDSNSDELSTLCDHYKKLVEAYV